MKNANKAAAEKYPYPELKGLSSHLVHSVKRDIDKYREGFVEGVNWEYDNLKADTFAFMEWTYQQGYDFVWSGKIQVGNRHMLWFKKDDPYITTSELYCLFKTQVPNPSAPVGYFTASQVRTMMRNAWMDRREGLDMDLTAANFDRYCKIKYPDL